MARATPKTPGTKPASMSAADAAVWRESMRLRQKALDTFADGLNRSIALGAYNAAADTRLLERIKSGVRWSADRSLSEDRPKLVAFSRAMDLNNSPCSAVVSRLVDLVIGQEIAPRAAADAPAYKAVALWNQTKDQMDVRGVESQGELQRAALREWLVAGDVGVNLVGEGLGANAVAPMLQLIEAERIGDPTKVRMRQATEKDRAIVDGVEIESTGRPVAYWVSDWDASGTTTAGKAKRMKAEGFLMPACRRRVGQTRGAPYLASALIRLAMLEEYHTAVQAAASLHAMFAAIVTTSAPQAFRSVMQTGSESAPGSGDDSGSTRVKNLMAAQNGSVMVLGPGEDMKGMQGSQPVASFDGYNQAVLRMCCAAAGLPVEVALLDVSRANFSVSRMAELMSQGTADVLRKIFLHQFVRPVWTFFVDWQISKGKLDRAKRDEYLAVTWHAPPRKMIDPEVETDTAIKQIENNLLGKDDYIESLGGDPDQIRQDRKREVEAEKKMGIEPPQGNSPQRAQSSQRKAGESGSEPGGKSPTTPDDDADPEKDGSGGDS